MLKPYLYCIGIALGPALSAQVLTIADDATLSIPPDETLAVRNGDVWVRDGGTMDLRGTLESDGSMDVDGLLDLAITGTEAGSGFGQLILGDALNLAAGLLQAGPVAPYEPIETTVYTFGLAPGGVNGPFTGTNLPGPLWSVSYGTNSVSLVFEDGKLPVTWLDFTATAREDRTVDLSWQTAQEDQNSHFEVERLATDQSWQTIGRVSGNGTTPLPSSYAFHDPDPGARTTIPYRLRQVDLDGTFDYSDIVTVSLPPAGRISLFPNPARDHIMVSGALSDAGEAGYRLLAADGRVLLEGILPVAGRLELPARIRSGTYVLEVRTVAGSSHLQLVVNR
jgi:hypothetical protein